jgi:hypothetical protein
MVSFQPGTLKFAAVEAEPTDTAEPELSVEALRLRVCQQELLSDFGVLALKGTPFPELLDHAVRLAAEGLKAEFAKVLSTTASWFPLAWAGGRMLSAKPLSVPTWHPRPDTHCGLANRSFPITWISRSASVHPNC